MSGRIRVAAPCRADLAGGTLDIWPLGVLHEGSITVATAIPVEVKLEVDLNGSRGEVLHCSATGELTKLSPEDADQSLTAALCHAVAPEAGVRVEVLSQAPLRSGIGGSSAYGIALVRALSELTGHPLSEQREVALVRDIEARILQAPTGTQDHWCAVKGGVVAVHLEPGGNRVEDLDVSLDWFSRRITVFFSGHRHHSGMVNWRVIRRRLDGDRATRTSFESIAGAAEGCRLGLLSADESVVAEAISREWKARRRLAPEVSTPEIDDLIRIARESGATAAKACGAGGGGSVLIWHPPEAQAGIAAALENRRGGHLLAESAASAGCRIIDS